MSATSSEPRRRGAALRVPWDRRRVGLSCFAAVSLALSVASLRFIEFSPGELIQGFRDSGYLSRALPPSFEGWAHSLSLVGRTFMMAVAGTALAGLLSIPLGFLAARNTAPSAWVSSFARGTIVATRAIPDLVWAVFFVAALSIGELPGVLALGIHSIGMLGKLLSDSIEEIDEGPREAAFAAGAGRMQAISNSVVPQVLPAYVSNLLYRLDINTRISVVLGFVGAGGIGFELRSNLRNPLRYPVGIGQALMVFGLIIMVDQISQQARRSLSGLTKVRANDRESTQRLDAVDRPRSMRPPWTKDRIVLSGFSAWLVVGAAWCCWQVGLHPVSFVRAIVKSAQTLRFFVPPDFSTHRDALFSGFRETLALGLAATFLGLMLAIPYSFLVARNTAPNRVVAVIAGLVQVILRSIPELVIVLMFVSAVGLGPVPGAAALTIGTFGFMSKLLADQLEGLPAGPQEGVASVGATRPQQIAAAVLPQAVPSIVSNSLYAFDINVRSSSVLGIVGAGGIGRLLDETINLLQYETVAAIVITLFVIVLLIEQLAVQVRKRLL